MTSSGCCDVIMGGEAEGGTIFTPVLPQFGVFCPTFAQIWGFPPPPPLFWLPNRGFSTRFEPKSPGFTPKPKLFLSLCPFFCFLPHLGGEKPPNAPIFRLPFPFLRELFPFLKHFSHFPLLFPSFSL